MSKNEAHVVPYLCYADAPAAIDFLCKAFGFEEQFRYPMPDGRIGHAELTCPSGGVMLASVWPEGGFASPLDLPAIHCMIHCSVDNTDAHYERAKAAGATITAEPSDQHGHRMYRATDPEGHRWIFAGPIRKPRKGSKE
jgi:PhnB protein